MEGIDFSKAGRNDPCPCGSGKKYKKCCFKTHQIKKQTQQSTAKLSDFIRPQQIPYLWLKGLQTILNRREWALLYQTFLIGGPLLEKYSTVEQFVEEARTQPTRVPAGGDFYLRRIRIADEHAFIMGQLNRDDRRTSTVTFEVLKITNTDMGYRIADIELRDYPKADFDGSDPAFEDFSLVTSTVEELSARPITIGKFERWMPDPETGLAIREADFLEAEAEEAAEAAAAALATVETPSEGGDVAEEASNGDAESAAAEDA